MIDGLYSALEQYPSQPQTEPRKVLRMVKNERMGGSVPLWETRSDTNAIEFSLNKAASSKAASAVPENALAYKAPVETPYTQSEEFGFGDLIDMINPLHHIPVVGQLYRGLTGDEIRPIGQIMGGALFGGPLGAASGLINVVIQEETGKDMAENAVAFMFDGQSPKLRSNEPVLNQSPEIRLAAIDPKAGSINTNPQNDLPGSLLAFVDLKERPEIVIERKSAAQGRTAGSFTQKSYPTINEKAAPLREPITQVRFNS